MTIATVGVIGGGQMGAGIAEVCARHGLSTILCDIDTEQLASAKTRIQKSLQRALAAGKIDQAQHDGSWNRLSFTTDIKALAPCDLTIEAIIEQLEAKQEVFSQLDAILSKSAILATNTSSLPIINIARATRKPERVIGMHFFNPAPVMPLIEMVRSIVTSDQTYSIAQAFGEQLDKRVIAARDRAGFIVNNLLMPYLNSAVRLLDAGGATREDIDDGMRLGCAHPMGPLRLLDYIGLDTAVYICDTLHAEYGNQEYVAAPLLRRMVEAGFLGQKSGRGFFEYES